MEIVRELRHARLGDQLCFALYSASKTVGAAYRSLLAPLGLTYPQYLVMLAVWENDGLTVAEVGAEVGLETSTLSPLLKRLEQGGFLIRRRDGADERVVRLHLTAAGADLEREVAIVRRQVETATGLTDAEFATLRATLLRLHDTVRARTAVTAHLRPAHRTVPTPEGPAHQAEDRRAAQDLRRHTRNRLTGNNTTT
jgi:MarR family transcriptional regulator, organic hydroperoxide resistance regulator